MDRDAIRREMVKTLAAVITEADENAEGWWARDVGYDTADALLAGPLARLVDIAEKAEAWKAAEDRFNELLHESRAPGKYTAVERLVEQTHVAATATAELRAAVGSPEGKP